MLGGYQIIDFNGVPYGESATVVGAFKKASTGKAILVENLAVDENTKITGFGTSFIEADVVFISTYLGAIVSDEPTFVPVIITITDEDVVSVTLVS